MNKEAILKAFKVNAINIDGIDVGTVIRELYRQLEASDPKGSFDKHMEYMQRNIELEKENEALRISLGKLLEWAKECAEAWSDDHPIQSSIELLEQKCCKCPPGTDRCITQGGRFPACTACKRRIGARS